MVSQDRTYMEPYKNKFLASMVNDKDAWRTNSWKDKFTLWFRHTGYRPADVAEKYPVYKIEDVYQFDKYDTKASTALNIWSWVQLMMILFFISYFFGNIALINKPQCRLYFLVWRFYFPECICIDRPDGQESLCHSLGRHPKRSWSLLSLSAE
jgi:hypothetical protein